MFDYYFFDLDGTLTDPGIGITNSVMFALKKYGIEVEKRSDLYKFIGPPLKNSFMKYYGFSEEEALKAVEYYREYFRPTGMFENTVYPDIEEALKALADNGKKLVVATAKPEVFAVEILKHFDLAKYFTFIAGASLDSSRPNKDAVIAYALNALEITDKSSVIMIGDRDQDINGAKNNGISSCGVLYGYGSLSELTECGADYIIKNPLELKSI